MEKSKAIDTYTIYQKDNKFIPINKSIGSDGAFYSSLLDSMGKTRESGSYGINLDFSKGYNDLKAATKVMQEKWGENINSDLIPIKEKYFVISDDKKPKGIEQKWINAKTGEPVFRSRIRPLKKTDYPGLAKESLRMRLDKKELSRKECDHTTFENFLEKKESIMEKSKTIDKYKSLQKEVKQSGKQKPGGALERLHKKRQMTAALNTKRSLSR